MSDYYDRQGRAITALQWRLEDNAVAKTTCDSGEVSTVYLGLDHRFGSAGPPLIFETMIFGGLRDQAQWRYTTEAEALGGHERAVALLRADENSRGIDAAAAAMRRWGQCGT